MSKIGEGSGFHEADWKVYQKDIEQSSMKFDKALSSYQSADFEERGKLKEYMDEQLELINAAVQESKRSGMHKQAVKVEKDYKEFIEQGSDESYSALKHDLQTLLDYNNEI